jgi:murein DD-endopeptidase MepM/ murein hydrolase activator NlpD
MFMAVDGGSRGRSRRISFAIETHTPVRAVASRAHAATSRSMRSEPSQRRPIDPRLLAPAFLAVALGAVATAYLGTSKPLGPVRAVAALTAPAADEPATTATAHATVVAPAAPVESAAAAPIETETETETAAPAEGAAPVETASLPDVAAEPATETTGELSATLSDDGNESTTAPWTLGEPVFDDGEQTTSVLPTDRIVTIGRGDTLMDVLRSGGVPADEAYAAITALRPVYDPRKLQIGQQLALTFGPLGTEADRFLGFKLDAAVDRVVTVGRDETGFLADVAEKPLATDLVRAEAEITSSLYVAGVNVGVPPAIMIQLIQLYSFDVDFQRDIQPGDAFAVMFENQYDESGKAVQQGDIVYATLTLQGQTIRLYRYQPGNGDLDYFNEKGESARKALLRTPVDGARLSSGFGLRSHPVLGYSRMHKGVDFAAPTGTPIYAAGNGAVEMAGINGGYGRYVRIRHNGDYATAYAHMNGFGAGIHNGARVRQGQIIGYVGSSGMSTGPHLHYEVLRAGAQINPMGLKLPSGQKLARGELAKFQTARADLDRRFAGLAPNEHIAERGGSDTVASTTEGGENTACAAPAKSKTDARDDRC